MQQVVLLACGVDSNLSAWYVSSTLALCGLQRMSLTRLMH
jgi:hypothetical protein